MAGHIAAWLGGGLGNRLPVLVSALRLAELYDRRLHVVWTEQPELHITLGDLFDRGALPFSIEVPNLTSRAHRTFPRTDERGYPTEPPRAEELPPDVFMVLMGYQFVAHHDDARSCDGEARDPFLAEMGRYFARMPLHASIARRVDDLSASLDFSRLLGVHIRRAASNSYYSHMDAGRDNWQMGWYVRSIEIILERHPHLDRIYVASNKPEASAHIRDKFGDIVFSNDRAGDGWSSLEFQKEAMVELIVLSRCAAILRQPGTTFSHFASVLECAPMITLHNIDPTTNEPILSWGCLGERRLT